MMKGIITPARGRPAKVVKATAAGPLRGRPVRRGDTVPNQDPDLEGSVEDADVDVDIDAENEQDHQQVEEQEQHQQHLQQQQQLQHHADFDTEASAAAAAAAAAVHHQQQQQQHHQQQQSPQQQHHQHQSLDLTAASILASSVHNSNDPSHHQHPDLGGPHGGPMDATSEANTTENLARESGYSNVVVESALAKRLAREPGMRIAQQRRPEQSLNLQRRSNVEALFAHIAGEMAPVPCKNCHKGHGPWTTCVVVDGQMCGSCANCWFNASGARCSFHETRNPQHGGTVMTADAMSFQLPPAPPQAMAPFNFASIPASSDPVVRYTVEQAMAQVRGADRKTRCMLMIEAHARQLAYQIALYEEAVQEEQQQQQQQQGQPPAVMNEPDAPY